MHELSVAQALIRLVDEHVPADASVHRVRIRVGPMQAIVSEALDSAWMVATTGSRFDGAQLAAQYLPWELSCPRCSRTWTSTEPYAPCACGCDQPAIYGTDELTLVAIDVDDSVRARHSTLESAG